MPEKTPKSKFGLWISDVFLSEQVSELKELQYMLQTTIKDSIEKEANWSEEGCLMTMFEFYSCIMNQFKIYNEAMESEPRISKETKEKEYYISSVNLDMLSALTRLATVNELSLMYDHRISFKVH